jgi:hypothetical protein
MSTPSPSVAELQREVAALRAWAAEANAEYKKLFVAYGAALDWLEEMHYEFHSDESPQDAKNREKRMDHPSRVFAHFDLDGHVTRGFLKPLPQPPAFELEPDPEISEASTATDDEDDDGGDEDDEDATPSPAKKIRGGANE